MKTPFLISADNNRQLFLLSLTLAVVLILIFIIPKSIQSSFFIVLIGTLSTLIIILSISKVASCDISSEKNDISHLNDSIITADRFLFEQLSSMDCKPEHENDDIIFHYKNGCFKAQWLELKVIRIVFPCIFSAPPSLHNALLEITNKINTEYVVVKIVTVPHSGKNEIIVHAIADFYYTSQNKETTLLNEILTQFIEIQTDFIKEFNDYSDKFNHTQESLISDFTLN